MPSHVERRLLPLPLGKDVPHARNLRRGQVSMLHLRVLQSVRTERGPPACPVWRCNVQRTILPQRGLKDNDA